MHCAECDLPYWIPSDFPLLSCILGTSNHVTIGEVFCVSGCLEHDNAGIFCLGGGGGFVAGGTLSSLTCFN